MAFGTVRGAVTSEHELREALADHYRRAEHIGLNELASGNLSCRFDDGMLISPGGATAATISADNIVRMSLDGHWQGTTQPSSEWPMHAAIYAAHAEAQAVVHTHSDYCVALACQERPLPGFHYLVGTFGGDDVPCVPYATFGTRSLGDAAARALSTRLACLLGNHGMICRGRSLEEALALAHRLEIMCRQYTITCQFGEPKLLSAAEWDEHFRQMASLGYGQPL